MMPIGVPRVPYRTPREGGWQWVDIWNCLVRRPRVCKCSHTCCGRGCGSACQSCWLGTLQAHRSRCCASGTAWCGRPAPPAAHDQVVAAPVMLIGHTADSP